MLKLIKIVPVLFLIMVALNQFRLVKGRELTPWKGGGFGMFSTVDARNARSLRIFAQVEGRMIEVMPMGKLETLVSKFVSLPDKESLDRILTQMESSDFYLNIEEGGAEFVINQQLATSVPIKESAIEFEFIHERYFYSKQTKTLEKKEFWRERVML